MMVLYLAIIGLLALSQSTLGNQQTDDNISQNTVIALHSECATKAGVTLEDLKKIDKVETLLTSEDSKMVFYLLCLAKNGYSLMESNTVEHNNNTSVPPISDENMWKIARRCAKGNIIFCVEQALHEYVTSSH